MAGEHEIIKCQDRNDPSVVRSIDITDLTLKAERAAEAHFNQKSRFQTNDEIDLQKVLVEVGEKDRERILSEIVALNKQRLDQLAQGKLPGAKAGDHLPALELLTSGASDNRSLQLGAQHPKDNDPTHTGLQKFMNNMSASSAIVFQEDNYQENGKTTEHVYWPLDRVHTDKPKPQQ